MYRVGPLLRGWLGNRKHKVYSTWPNLISIYLYLLHYFCAKMVLTICNWFPKGLRFYHSIKGAIIFFIGRGVSVCVCESSISSGPPFYKHQKILAPCWSMPKKTGPHLGPRKKIWPLQKTSPLLQIMVCS